MSKLQKNDANRKKLLHQLNNDNIDAASREVAKRAKIRAARNRRLIAFFILATIVIGFLGNMIMNQNARLAEKKDVKEKLQVELAEIEDMQEMLNLQLAKLDDDEYIAKLIRKEYFLSEEGEIIFTMPEDKSADKK